jgi:hypothetical protein
MEAAALKPNKCKLEDLPDGVHAIPQGADHEADSYRRGGPRIQKNQADELFSDSEVMRQSIATKASSILTLPGAGIILEWRQEASLMPGYRGAPAALNGNTSERLTRLIFRPLFIAALLSSCISLLLYLVAGGAAHYAFPLLTGFKILPPHTDMRWVTSLSECGVDLQALADGKICGCSPNGSCGGLGYPPMSVQTARILSIKGSHTELLGFSMGLANIAILCLLNFRLVTKRGAYHYLTGAIILLGFPLQLALERGNIDIVIFVLFASISALLPLSRLSMLPIAGFLSWMVVAIKLYPLPGILAWNCLDIIRVGRPRLLNAVVMLGALAGFLHVLPWLLQSGESAAQPSMGVFSHGLISDYPFVLQLAEKLPWRPGLLHSLFSRLWGLMIFLCTLLAGKKLRINHFYSSLIGPPDKTFESGFLHHFVGLTTCTWLACYVFASSFDYRMIFGLPAFICIMSFAGTKLISSQKKLLPVGLLLVITITLISSPMLLLSASFGWSVATLTALTLCAWTDYLFLPILAGLAFLLIAPNRRKAA